ncbi:MAG: ABC transporter permease [Bacteroidota bacterium]
MLQNYLKIAWRNLAKYRFYSFINIAGLSIGMATFFFMFMFVKDELGFDQYHENAADIIRLDFHAKLGDNEMISAVSAAPLGPTLVAELPEVRRFFRFRDNGSFLVSYQNDTYKEEAVIYADSSFFQFFSIPMIAGNAEKALVEPNTIVLSDEMAKKYFGTAQAVGKILRLDNRFDYTVTGVMQAIPDNTHFQFDFLLSMSSLEESRGGEWGGNNFSTYCMVRPGTNLTNLKQKIQTIFLKNFEVVLQEFTGGTYEDFLAGGNYAHMEMMPLTDIHLRSDKEEEIAANGDIRYIYIFGFIGLFILLIACVNFVNLSTARSVNRAKEVGVRKVVGAVKGHLIKQFLSESLLIATVSLLIAYGILHAFLPAFNQLASKGFDATLFYTPSFLSTAVGICLLSGLLSGIYPAFVLADFKPIKVLKGGLYRQNSGRRFRDGLVVFQFFITTLLIVGTLVIFKQLSFMQNKKLGFNKEQVLVVNDAYALGDNTQIFKEKVVNNPIVSSASLTGFLPTPSNRNTNAFFKGKAALQENAILLANWTVDFDYVKTMGLEIIAGRDFNSQFSTDSSAVIINEELARQLGYDNPVGEYLSNNYERDGKSGMDIYPIIGVIKNFHFASLRESISPLALFVGNSRGALSIRTQTEDLQGFINQLEADWNVMAPGQPFSYQFLDERFNRMFEGELQLGKIAGVFAILAIFIACIGLLGLATFIAQQRTKEIGIRKVLGADIGHLVYLLCKDFGRLIVIAFLLAVPLSWYAMTQWLEDFAYATSFGVGVFLFAASLIGLMAILSVLYQTTRVALVNPVETIKWD